MKNEMTSLKRGDKVIPSEGLFIGETVIVKTVFHNVSECIVQNFQGKLQTLAIQCVKLAQ